MGRVKRTRSTIVKSGFKLEYPRRLTLLIGRVTLEIRIRFVYCEVNELCKAAAITHTLKHTLLLLPLLLLRRQRLQISLSDHLLQGAPMQGSRRVSTGHASM